MRRGFSLRLPSPACFMFWSLPPPIEAEDWIAEAPEHTGVIPNGVRNLSLSIRDASILDCPVSPLRQPQTRNLLRHPKGHVAGERAAGRYNLDCAGCRAGGDGGGDFGF
jgi:hypothetical protein